MSRLLLIVAVLLASSGCGLLPQVVHEPVIRNPFPQLQRVAVAPFFNLSNEKTVDGLQFANAYFAELQMIPGFEVVPPSVVGEAIFQNQLQLDNAQDARRLAELLGVDVVVVGAVTDYSPYYPPRVGLRVEWFAANACFHEIPPGYGLPWGTPEEEFIPDSLVYESQFALAKAQLATQTPHQHSGASSAQPTPMPGEMEAPGMLPSPSPESVMPLEESSGQSQLRILGERSAETVGYETDAMAGATGMTDSGGELFPTDWPDMRAFIPPGPSPAPVACEPFEGAILSHTKIYQGNDAELTTALANYAYFRDDLRPGGWKAVLQRDDEFIRFCCRMHISEMLAARGGADKTRVVWGWSNDR
jgi:hypothetical protein